MSSAQRMLKVREQIHDACRRADRNPAGVQLIAVSKTFPKEALQPVYAAGQRHFGENYAQELDEKARALAEEGSDIVWHYIGRIQSNKIKYIAAHATYVHAVEKFSHAQALGAKAPRPIKIFVSVNIGREESKGGLMPEEVLDTCVQMHQIENVEVCGLMCLPPRTQDPEDSAPMFAEMA
ncbi:MAG: YggS family pyridoxal phosphate-dependent enzyme, partial [Nannocystaceae bacterium]